MKLLDCTLRDGAHVNRGMFGADNISLIIEKLVAAKVDIIEIGFMKDCKYDIDKVYFSDFEDVEQVLSGVNLGGSKIAVMIRVDEFDVSKIRASHCVDIIRIAFYPEDIGRTEKYIQCVKGCDFKVFLNPLAISTLSSDERVELYHKCNTLGPTGVSIVDTFGALDLKKIEAIVLSMDEILDKSTIIGIHLHENLSLSMGMIQFVLQCMKVEREWVVDGSLHGMGRIPGNVPTELVASFFNNEFDTQYGIEPMLQCIDRCIIYEREKRSWGYSPSFMLPAIRNQHRSFGEHLLEKCGHSCSSISKLLDHTRDGSRFDASAIPFPKVTAVIPVKGNSSRLPNKNILPFGNSTLLEHKIEQLKRVSGIDEIVVSTDSDVMLEAAKRHGVRGIRRPCDLADESRPLADFFEYIVDTIDDGVLVWACCTSPLFDSQDLQSALDTYKNVVYADSKYDSLITTYTFKHYMMDENGPLNYRLGTQHCNSQDIPPWDLFTNGVIISLTSDVRKWKYNYGPCSFRFNVSQSKAVDIDTKEDYEYARALFAMQKYDAPL